MWPSKPEVRISPRVWQIKYHYNSDCKPGVFDQGELAKSVNKWYNIERQPKIAIWPPKPEIVIPLETTTDSVEIPTANPGFSTMTSQNKVSPTDCDNDQQPEMAMWPPKLEILISLELRQIGWEFQRQIWGCRQHPAWRNMTPSAERLRQRPRKQQYRRFGRQSCNFW